MKAKHIKAYMTAALAFAQCSNAERLKVGSVIVKRNRIISCGYNAFPEHITESKCELEDNTTDPRVRHAEKNALLGVMKSNESTEDAVLFCTHYCCLQCSIDIVDSGITKVYVLYPYRDNKGVEYLQANNVTVTKLNVKDYENIKL